MRPKGPKSGVRGGVMQGSYSAWHALRRPMFDDVANSGGISNLLGLGLSVYDCLWRSYTYIGLTPALTYVGNSLLNPLHDKILRIPL